MKKVIAFNLHRYGDLVMNTVAARCFKRHNPKSFLTMGINHNFQEIAPLFYNHPYIDGIYITDTEQGGYSEKDWEWIDSQKFDYVFNPMQDHPDQQWYKHRIQGLETAFMHGLDITGDDGHYELVKWFKSTDNFKDFIAFMPYAGNYSPINNKTLTQESAQYIVDCLIGRGLKVLQLGGKSEPRLDGAVKLETSFFDSVKNMLDCRALIHTDTGLGHVAAAYDFPSIGLYSHQYYGKEFIHNVQPLNKNAIYLDADNVNNITTELIIEKLHLLLK